MSKRWGLWVLAVLGVLAGCADRDRSVIADGRLTATPGGLDLQRVAVFDGREVEVVLRNVGRARINIDEAWVEGAAGAWRAEFTHEGPHSLVPGSECVVRVRFSPQQEGDMPATLVVRSDARQEPLVRVRLQGTAVDAWARLSPKRLDFGRIEADSTKTLSFTATNPTDLPVEVTPKLLGAQKDEFQAEPVVLQPGETREVPVTFAPVLVGAKQVALAVSPCRGCSDVAVQMTAEALERAVVAEPPELDFGSIPVDKDSLRVAKLHNLSTEPMAVTAFALTSTEASFTHAAIDVPLVLQPGETRSWEFRYSPGHMGEALNVASFRVESRRHPTTDVALRGFGGAAELCVSPLSRDFGPQPLGSKTVQVINVKNCGAANGGPLNLLGLDLQPLDGSTPETNPIHLTAQTLPHRLLPGEEVNLRVYFEPTREGAARSQLVMRTDVFEEQDTVLAFSGVGERHAPCQITVTPLAMNFGTVEPGRGAVLGVKVNNQARDLCAVKNIRMNDNGGGVFSLPGGELEGLIVYPGDSFSFMVAFASPLGGGDFTGSVQIEQWDPANPRVLIPLSAHSQSACLVASPRYVDFGVSRPDCSLAPREVNYLNACRAPVTVSNVYIGAGTSDGEFQLSDVPPPPITLPPGGAFTVQVDYLAQVFGLNLSPLFVESSDLPDPLLVSLVGESSKRMDKTDKFVQQDGAKVDVLFVVDNTASMVEEQPRLRSAMPAFVDTARAKGVDLHLAVTTTGIDTVSNACPGGAQGGEAGRFFPVDGSRPRILTLQTPDVTSVLQQNVNVGLCASLEQGFEAVRRALSPPLVNNADDPRTPVPNDGNRGFLRDEAALVVVFVGDEDDHSPDSVDTYVRFLRERKGENQPQRMTLYAIAPTAQGCPTSGGGGTRYAEAAARTGGEVISVCEPDYSPLLRSVANKAFSPQDRFPLSDLPDAGSITVSVNGAPVTAGWQYDGATNSVIFTTAPAAGAKVDIYYRRACS
ncbi:choice-of-anchor D domain-containing protein [Archangium primigenium]|uniref:choice-of-anchor D domain-containing protein n=1 Tax=[Archangium] primigenium TaxID=2792470 RepID=UPI00195D429A|nr:choice-of-anchor D domain-containing protein [Archangium primigenium]MBM7115219.1 choice-of-anchor D domain-containing protein [Archangium primigenium]